MTVETDTRISQILDSLGIEEENSGAFAGEWLRTSGERVESLNPATGEPIAAVRFATADDYEKVAAVSVEAFREWQTWPAPKRGEIVRQLGDELRRHKEELGLLVTLEAGSRR
jgi:aldehyde dehydrogenase (NAD+)